MSSILDQQPNLKRQGKSSQFEEELNRPEKKRQGEGSQLEEEPTRVVEEAYDRDCNEADSDDCDGDNFTTYQEITDGGIGYDEPHHGVNDEEERKCNKVRICHMYQHKSTFDALPVFELYKVKLIFSENLFSPSGELSGKLYGLIDTNTSPETPEHVYYYRVIKKKPVPITLNVDTNVFNLTLSGDRTSPPVAWSFHLRVFFAFKFESSNGGNIDVFKNWSCLREDENAVAASDAEVFDGDEANYAYLNFPPNSFGLNRKSTCYISREIVFGLLNASIKVAAYYAIYGGAWASVNVKILKKGVSHFYGFIYARPCIFLSRTRLNSLQQNEMRELQANTSIELTRPVVAVPSFSSLIIAAVLYDQNDNLIVRGKTFFPASENGTDVKLIGDDNVEIQVEWACRKWN